MNRCGRGSFISAMVLVLAAIGAAALSGCTDIFGERNNPVDPNSEKYQGYPVVADLATISAVSPAVDASFPATTSLIPLIVSAIAGADRYRVQVSSTSGFETAGVLADVIQETAMVAKANVFSIQVDLLHAGALYWRAQASKSLTWGVWTAAQRFSLQTVPVASVIVTGTGGATTITADGGTLQMLASVAPSNATIKSVDWSVANGTGRAAIDASGLLTAASNGTVTVTASARDGSGASGTRLITISNQIVEVTGIVVTGAGGETSIATDKGKLQMSAAILPADASNKTVAWSVDDGTGHAAIDSSGLLTASANGTVTVVAAANDGSGVSGSLQITLSNQTVLVLSIFVNGMGGVSVVQSGSTLQMLASVSPGNATDGSVAWSVANGSGSATISASGLLSAAANGTVTVTASANDGSGVTGTREVTIGIPVTSITVSGTGGATTIVENIGSLQMLAAVLPVNASDKAVVWSVVNGTGVASISPTGLLSAIANGTVTVFASAHDGSGIMGSIVITLSNQTLLAPDPPSPPDLAADDDTGRSDSDNVTKKTSGLTLSGTAKSGTTITIKDGGSTILGTVITDGSGNYTYEASLAAGTHQISATASLYELISAPSPALNLVIDTTVTTPSVPDLAAEDDTGISNSDNITMKQSGLSLSGGGAEPDAIVTLVSVLYGIVGTTTASADGTWSIDISLGDSSGVRARQEDLAGNVSAESSDLLVTIDSTGSPVSWSVRLLTPSQGKNTGKNKRPTFKWTQAASAQGYTIVIDDDPGYSHPELEATLAGSSTTSYTPASDLPVSGVQPVGRRYYVGIYAVDTAGNAYYNPSDTSAQRYVNVGRFDNDMNGDGYSDLVIGAYSYDDGANADVGRVYVYFGGISVDTVPDVVITGTLGNPTGSDYAAAGDLNGDGFCDLALSNGSVYFGGSSMDAAAELQLVAPSGSISYVWRAGDLNGDGYADLAVTHSNNVSVYFGGSAMNGVSDLTMANGNFNFGGSVGSAGDLNLDGCDELLIGNMDYDIESPVTADAGSTGIYYGGASMDTAVDVFLTGSTSGKDYFGHGVAGAGDMNGDGIQDIAVGLPGAVSSSGKAYVYFGPSYGSLFNTTADATLTYTQAGEELGVFVAGGGDINGDGYDDIVAGSPRYDGPAGTNAGRATVLYGSASPLSVLRIDGNRNGGSFGFRVTIVGDCNADGYADFAVSAPDADSNGVDSGSVYLYFGNSSGVTAPIEFIGENAGDKLGDWPGYAVGG